MCQETAESSANLGDWAFSAPGTTGAHRQDCREEFDYRDPAPDNTASSMIGVNRTVSPVTLGFRRESVNQQSSQESPNSREKNDEQWRVIVGKRKVKVWRLATGVTSLNTHQSVEYKRADQFEAHLKSDGAKTGHYAKDSADQQPTPKTLEIEGAVYPSGRK